MSPNYKVICDVCYGRRYIAGKLCAKCNGDDSIDIPDVPLTFSQSIAKGAGVRLIAIVLAVLVIAAVLRYFGVF